MIVRAELQIVQLRIEPARVEELLVGAALDDPALAHACRARGGVPEALALEWVDRTPGPPGAGEFLAARPRAVPATVT